MARNQPELKQIILDRPPGALDKLSALQAAEQFRISLRSLLDIYGERTGAGLGSDTSIRTPTWREQPELVLALVAGYLDPAVEAPALARARVREKRDAQVETLCEACDDPALIAEFRRQLAYVRRDATVLEEHNHYIDQMATGQVRGGLLAAGRLLAAQNQLTEPGDVFWLHLQELLAILRGDARVPCAEIVARHQSEYKQWRQLQAPAMLGIPPSKLPPRPDTERETVQQPYQDPDHLTGKGASPGRRRGRARVVAMGTIVPDVAPGDVLVAENAGPLWTPIFPILNGIILDQGVVLGHAAVVAREYGVPAVMDTVHGTRQIPDGACVTLDGTEGIVEIERGSGT